MQKQSTTWLVLQQCWNPVRNSADINNYCCWHWQGDQGAKTLCQGWIKGLWSDDRKQVTSDVRLKLVHGWTGHQKFPVKGIVFTRTGWNAFLGQLSLWMSPKETPVMSSISLNSVWRSSLLPGSVIPPLSLLPVNNIVLQPLPQMRTSIVTDIT